jgi:hypothetical protein
MGNELYAAASPRCNVEGSDHEKREIHERLGIGDDEESGRPAGKMGAGKLRMKRIKVAVSMLSHHIFLPRIFCPDVF